MFNLEHQLQKSTAEFLNIDPDRKTYTMHYNALRDTIYSMLKADMPLGKWLSGHKLGGSYGDNLKITKPDEFDLVIFLKFPENNRIIVKKDPQRPGNVTLDMTEVLKILHNQEHNSLTYTNLKKLVTSNNLLMEDKLQNFISGKFTRVLNKMDMQIIVDGKPSKIVYKRCGPAHTVFINEPDMNYSVDFVPAIRLSEQQNILGSEQLKYFRNIEYWDAIPKPLKPFQANNTSFRASYSDAEKEMLRDKEKLKNVIKLMKKFRDSKPNMNNLKSYYIKTLLLWQIKLKPATYWRNQKLSEILIDMFHELGNCLAIAGRRKGKLPFFWDPNLDMFASFNQNQRNNMHDCVVAEHYTLKRAAGNLTQDIQKMVTCLFSNLEERGEIQKKTAKQINGVEKPNPISNPSPNPSPNPKPNRNPEPNPNSNFTQQPNNSESMCILA